MLYTALSPGHIRLMKLNPGDWKDKLEFELISASLETAPRYRALSYVWGAQNKTVPAYCLGHEKRITINLDSCLRRLRSTDEQITLWVDALCINQADLKERSTQVQLMREVYSRSTDVIVYLGEIPRVRSSNSMVGTSSASSFEEPIVFYNDERDEPRLRDFEKRMCTGYGQDPQKNPQFGYETLCFLRLLAESSDLSRLAEIYLLLRKNIDSLWHRHLFEALRLLMLRNWWSRIWVVQEIVVPDRVTIQYGSIVAPWGLIHQAAQTISQHRESVPFATVPHEYAAVLIFFARGILDIEKMRSVWRKTKCVDLLQLLRRFGGRKSSDDRDKVYGLLGMIDKQSLLTPDYSLSLSSIFQNAVLSIIACSNSLDVFVGNHGNKQRRGLPSWVPDWSAAYDDLEIQRAETCYLYNATSNCRVLAYAEDHRWNTQEQDLKDLAAQVGDPNLVLNHCDLEEAAVVGRSALKYPDDEKHPQIDDLNHTVEDICMARGGPVWLRAHPGGHMSLPGICIDTITVVGDVAYSYSDILEVLRNWVDMISLYNTRSSHPGNNGRCITKKMFLQTLCADIIYTARGSSSNFRRITETDLEALIAWLHHHDESGTLEGLLGLDEIADSRYARTSGSSGHVEGVATAVKLATYRRSLFITKEGYIGLCPPRTKLGDEICILLGGRTPFVVRQNTLTPLQHHLKDGTSVSRNLCYELIGDCYAHGLMDGEYMPVWKQRVLERQSQHSKWQALTEVGRAPSVKQGSKRLVGRLSEDLKKYEAETTRREAQDLIEEERKHAVRLFGQHRIEVEKLLQNNHSQDRVTAQSEALRFLISNDNVYSTLGVSQPRLDYDFDFDAIDRAKAECWEQLRVSSYIIAHCLPSVGFQGSDDMVEIEARRIIASTESVDHGPDAYRDEKIEWSRSIFHMFFNPGEKTYLPLEATGDDGDGTWVYAESLYIYFH